MSPAPADFFIRYDWTAGPLPPPWHWEFTIEIMARGAGQIAVLPDYPSPKVRAWTEQFAVHPFHIDWIYGVLTDNHLFDADWARRGQNRIGGGAEWMVVHADGRKIDVPSSPPEHLAAATAAMCGSVRALVPDRLWESLTAKREKYVRKYRPPR